MRKIKRALPATAPILLCWSLTATPADALTFNQDVPDLKGIATGATLAFRGRVFRTDAGQAKGYETSMPYTTITLVVDEPYRGCERGQEIVLRQMGGPLFDRPSLHYLVPGLASFSPGDEVVVFANDREQPFFGTYFGDYGVLRVAKDQSGLRRVLDEKWRPVVRQKAGLQVDSTRRCQATRGAPERCRLDRIVEKERALGVAELDQLIHEWTGNTKTARRPQVIAHDRARFEAALSAYVRQDMEAMQRTLRESN